MDGSVAPVISRMVEYGTYTGIFSLLQNPKIIAKTSLVIPERPRSRCMNGYTMK